MTSQGESAHAQTGALWVGQGQGHDLFPPKGVEPRPGSEGWGWWTNQWACRGRRQGIALRDMYLIIGLTLREQSNVTLRSMALRDRFESSNQRASL